MLKHLFRCFICLFSFSAEGNAQLVDMRIPLDLEHTAYAQRYFEDRDSILLYPDQMRVLFIDGQSKEEDRKIMRKIKKEPQAFSNLSNLHFSPRYSVRRIPAYIWALPKLNLIISSDIPIGRIPKKYRPKIQKAAIHLKENTNYQKWQKMFYTLTNLTVIEIYLSDPITIDKRIENLHNLQVLRISTTGPITFPKSVANLSNLRSIDISGCLYCTTFLDSLPASMERINIRHTGIKKFNFDIKSLQKLTSINLSESAIEHFPEDFNFSQLKYFSAPERLFSLEKWAEIKKSVKYVVMSYSGRW